MEVIQRRVNAMLTSSADIDKRWSVWGPHNDATKGSHSHFLQDDPEGRLWEVDRRDKEPDRRKRLRVRPALSSYPHAYQPIFRTALAWRHGKSL